MARLSRYTQLLFGSGAGSNQMAKFGSLAAGSAATFSGSTITPTIIQSLSNYLTGWFGAILGSNSPTIEDMNAICYLFAYQLAYLMQQGVPEYDSATTYYTGSICQFSGRIYASLTDTNVGNALSNTTNWKVFRAGVRTITTNTTLVISDDIVRSNSTSGSLTHTLPTIASSIGHRITIKDVGTGGNTTSIKGNGAELIDGNNTYSTTLSQYDSLSVYNNGTTWDVI